MVKARIIYDVRNLLNLLYRLFAYAVRFMASIIIPEMDSM